MISALALCAEQGGAAGIRAEGPENIKNIKETVSIPVIGIHKEPLGARFFITPKFEHAEELARSGADLIALEATYENRPIGRELDELIVRIREELEIPVVADVSVFEEGLRAWELGAELVATTLSGYTQESRGRPKPDLDLIERLVDEGVRVMCEGHIRTPEEAREAMQKGAYAVVVGTAITNPVVLTSRFAEAVHRLTPNRSETKGK